MSEITEYQKVAALVCMDIDVMVLAAENNPNLALGLLQRLQEMKNTIVIDPDKRDSRYDSSCIVFGLAVKND